MTRRREEDHYGKAAPSPAEQLAGTMFDLSAAPAPQPTHVVEVCAHLRHVAGDAPPSGAERRDAALAEHEADDQKRIALDYVRGKLAALYHERVLAARWTGEKPGVTADDADRILREWPHFPKALRELASQNWRGAIFNRGAWEQTGESITAKRDHMHATKLPCWRLRETGERRAS